MEGEITMHWKEKDVKTLRKDFVLLAQQERSKDEANSFSKSNEISTKFMIQ